ncbi:MAG: hypothetical protein ACUVV0_08045 [Anaerolineae bacterium]
MDIRTLQISLSEERFQDLQDRAIMEQKSINELISDIIDQWLSLELTTLESVLSEFWDDFAETDKSAEELEKLYQEYYTHAEDDLSLVRNIQDAQMRAFAVSERV